MCVALYCTLPYNYTLRLVMILIWRFGGFSTDCQIKITANTVVLSQILINSNDERPYPPNLMFAKCTTHMVYLRMYYFNTRYCIVSM